MLELGFQNQPANSTTAWINNQPTAPNGPNSNNAQFVVQPSGVTATSADWNNLRRIAIDVNSIPASGEVTIYMNWTGPGNDVKYALAYGAFDSSNFPSTPDISWSIPKTNDCIPETSATTYLHFNLWPYNGPSTGNPATVIISNLEMPS